MGRSSRNRYSTDGCKYSRQRDKSVEHYGLGETSPKAYGAVVDVVLKDESGK